MKNSRQLQTKTKYFGKLSIKNFVFITLIFLILIFQIFPLLNLIYTSLKTEGGITLSNLIDVYFSRENLIALRNTLLVSFSTMILSTTLSIPIAFLICRTDILGKKLLRKIFYLGYMLPPFIGAMSWIMLLNPNVGLINNFIKSIFNMQRPIFNIYSMAGLIFIMTIFYFPYSFITIVNGFEKMDTSLEEAAIMCKASQIRTFFIITLPIMIPTIISSAVLVFVASISSYGIPIMIGSNAKISTITTKIFELASYGDMQMLSKAGILATMLMMMVFFVLITSYFILKKYSKQRIKNYSIKKSIKLGKYRFYLSVVVAVFSIVVVVIPFISIVITSFIKDLSKPIVFKNLTLDYWRTIFTHSSIVSSIKNSIIASVVAATLALFIAIVVSYYSTRSKIFGKKLPEIMVMISSTAPNIVIAIALIMAFTGKYVINLYNTIFILILAYMSKYMFMAIRNISQAILNIRDDIEEAARGFGASDFKIVKDVIFPIILPSLIAGWFLVFMPSFYELAMSILLYSPSTSTIGVELYQFQLFFSHQVASALAVMVIIFILMLNVLSSSTRKKYRHESN